MKKKIFPLLVCLAIGVSHTYFGLQGGTLQLAKTAFQWLQMQSWQTLQAEIISVDIKKIPSSFDSESEARILFRIEAKYRYRINAEDYSGDRVGYNVRQYDNFSDDWHNKQYDRLSLAKSRGDTITIWVDPRHPQESIVDPSPRWAEINSRLPSLLFLVFGIASLGFSWRIFRTEDMDVFTGDKYEHVPGKPWWHEIWKEDGVNASTTKATIVFGFLITTAMTAITIPLSIWLLYSQDSHWFIIFFCSIIFAFTVLIIWLAIIETISWSRYGQLTLRMLPFPAALGNNLHAIIGLPNRNFIDKTYVISLVCNYVDARGEGETTKLLWKKALSLHPIETENTAKIEFDIDLPVDLPETTPPTNVRHEWRILLSCKDTQAGLSTDFLIPVFQKI
jgi:Protein of unknown function (DUF3592)